MRRKNGQILKIILSLCLFMSFLTGCAKKADGPLIYAEKISADEIQTGDRLAIVGDTCGRTFAGYPRSFGIETAIVRRETIGEKQVLTYIADDAQILTAEKTEKGLLFRCDLGYVGTSQGARDMDYRPEITDGCYWTQQGNGKLRTLTKKEDGSDLEVYLGYFSKSDGFSGYTIREEGVEPDSEPFSFFRITDAWDKRDLYTEDYWLKMYQTSDVHGFIAFDDGLDWQLRMARNAYTINQARSRTGTKRNDTVLLLDGGDVFQGSLFSSLLGWEPLSAVYDAMEYDAVAIGNHEFDKGLRYVMDPDGTMMGYTRNGEFHENHIPYVTCNLYQNGKKIEGLREYVILDKTAVNNKGEELPVRIGVIGFAEDYQGSVSPEQFIDLGYEIREDYDYAMSLAAKLKKEDGCDAVVLLCHGDSGRIANNLREGCEIDLVLGGHLHKLQDGETSWGLKYASPGNKSDSITNADFIFTKKDGKAALKTMANVHASYITNNEVKETLYDTPENRKTMDDAVYVIGNDYLVLLSNMLNIRIGYITTEAKRYEYLPNGGMSSTSAGNWFASMYQRAGGAEIGLCNVGGIRQDYLIPEGEDRRYINAGDVYTMFTFDDPIMVFEITYEELLTAFRYTAMTAGHGLLARMVGIDCYFRREKEGDMGEVYAIVTKDGEAIYDHGVWLDGWKDKKVTVAMPSYSAVSDRVATDGTHNPYTAWAETNRVISKDISSVDAVMKVLMDEAEEKNGLLEIDTTAHLLDMDYIPAAQ